MKYVRVTVPPEAGATPRPLHFDNSTVWIDQDGTLQVTRVFLPGTWHHVTVENAR